jgi:hypothetical protein
MMREPVARDEAGVPILQTCGRRMNDFGPWPKLELLDHWNIQPNGDRTCSFCGSLHHDDFYRLVVASLADDSTIRIEVSDKRYKIYVHRPEIRNAAEGGIKFYKHHDVHWTDEQRAEIIRIWPDVIGKSSARFEQVMERLKLRFPVPETPPDSE